jgi:crotonobetainyl-CoA:carnitine CoA-transferase CaiB-like acyl-CoA transferase
VPVSPIQTAGQVLEDPQLAALEQMETLFLPGHEDREVLVPRLPFELSKTPAETLDAPPALGQHGRAILYEAGYTETEIDELVRSGVCKLP